MNPLKRVWGSGHVYFPGEMIPNFSYVFREASDQKRFQVTIVGVLKNTHNKDLKYRVENKILS